jgi:hypothetical protein
MSDRPWGEIVDPYRLVAGRRIGPLCANCDQPIQWSPGAGDPYWYHPATSSIWCDGWGDPAETGRQAELPKGGVGQGPGAREDDTIPYKAR